MNAMNNFTAVILVMLFYSFGITMFTYSLPADSLNYVDSFSDLSNTYTLESIGADVQEGLEQQTNIPVLEVGALVFYSGNILIDLILNFIFAIPEMVGLLIAGLCMLINIDTYLVAIVELFSSVVIFTFGFISIIQLLTGLRSGRLV